MNQNSQGEMAKGRTDQVFTALLLPFGHCIVCSSVFYASPIARPSTAQMLSKCGCTDLRGSSDLSSQVLFSGQPHCPSSPLSGSSCSTYSADSSGATDVAGSRKRKFEERRSEAKGSLKEPFRLPCSSWTPPNLADRVLQGRPITPALWKRHSSPKDKMGTG